jgi:F-type H+-transporting ATPase subunit delta
MPSRSISRKYAEALFHLAQETDGIDAVRNDMESLAQVLRQIPALHSFIESPDVAEAEKTAFFEKTIRGGVKNATWQFLQLLLRRKRTILLPEILSEYVQMDEERKGIQRVRVVSAVALDKSEKEALTSRLQALTGKTILIDTRVDPSVLGGVIVYLDGKVIDGSIRTCLAELKGRLLATSLD